MLFFERRWHQLRLIPDDLFEMPGMKDFLEWSLLRAWVRSWLRYCRWYYMRALRPDVTIEQLFYNSTASLED